MFIIDAHAHLYSDDDKRYPSIANPIRPPNNSGSLSRLQTLLKENGIAGVCVVQPGTFYGWDNRFICDAVQSFPRDRVAICTLDPDDPNSHDLLKRYIKCCGVRGLRSLPSSGGHLDHPGVQSLWKAAGEERIVINVLIGSDNVDELARMLEKFPRQRVVIDHCLVTKPNSELNALMEDMLRLAKFPNTYAKLSFLPLGSQEGYPFRDMHETCKRIIGGYGADRCVWGSNFPCELWTPQSSYAQNLRLFTDELELRGAVQQAILGGTARQLWFLDRLGTGS